MLVLLFFVIALFFNIPIALSLGVASVGYACLSLFQNGDVAAMNMVIQSFTAALDSTPLLAIPFFCLAGDIMLTGGISRRLVNACLRLMKGIPGALGIAAVVACMIFAAISGSGPATCAAIGGILLPAMAKDGYNKGFSAALVATAGALGPIIPPSLSFIMYGVVAQQSISSLFMSGIVPGVLMGLALIFYVIYCSKKFDFGGKSEIDVSKAKNWRDSAVWAFLFPVIILGGIYSGIFTPTEAAIVATDYGLIVSLFIYRELKFKDLWKTFKPTCMTIGSISIIACGAMAFGRLLTLEMVPTLLAEFILSISTQKWVVLMMINIFLLFVGCVMETLSAIIILTPLFLPVVQGLGVDPIHFGCIMVVNLVIGMCTPPVGVNLFVALRLGQVGLGEISKWLIAALACCIAVLMLITYVPSISLFLPNLLMK